MSFKILQMFLWMAGTKELPKFAYRTKAHHSYEPTDAGH